MIESMELGPAGNVLILKYGHASAGKAKSYKMYWECVFETSYCGSERGEVERNHMLVQKLGPWRSGLRAFILRGTMQSEVLQVA